MEMQKQKAYLVALQQGYQRDWEVEENLKELAELSEDAGLEVVDTFVQKRNNPEPGTFIGKGKALELAEIVEDDSIVIFDDELTPAQQGNLSDLLDTAVIDRTQLILDIFAQRAQSNEGKIQVELAQLNYLLPRLTGTDAYIADQLFATLDPAIRRCDLQEGRWVYLSDTVGFIRKLPHTLVAAFQATLEEVVHADLLLHVIDASHPQSLEQKEAVEEVLKEIGATQPIISVYNKIDLLPHEVAAKQPNLGISARTGQNLEMLVDSVGRFFAGKYSKRSYFFPFAKLGEANELRENSQVLSEKFTPHGVFIEAEVDEKIVGLLRSFEK